MSSLFIRRLYLGHALADNQIHELTKRLPPAIHGSLHQRLKSQATSVPENCYYEKTHPLVIPTLWACICVVGIIAVRSIPSPVISTLGTDESDEQTNEELKDIVAAINN